MKDQSSPNQTPASRRPRVARFVADVIAAEPFWYAAPAAGLGGIAAFGAGTTALQGLGLALLGATLGLLGWGWLQFIDRVEDARRRQIGTWIGAGAGLYTAFTPLAATEPASVIAQGWFAVPVLAGLVFLGVNVYATAQALRRGPERMDEPFS
jgi:hypothetical protein